MNPLSNEPDLRRIRRTRIIALASVSVSAAALIAMTPLIRSAWQESRRQIAMERMRDTLQALRYAAMERGGSLPPATGWDRELGYLEKLESPRMLDSGRVEGPTPDWGYKPPIPAPGQTHATLSEIEQPSMYVLLYEDTSRLPSQYTSVIVGMADGSVQMIDRATLEAMLAAQKLAGAASESVGGGPE